MSTTLALFFVFLSCIGLTYPNAAAIALAPFSKNAGSASALLGFLQMGTGALISTGIGFFRSGATAAIIALLSGTALMSQLILLAGKRNIVEKVTAEDEDAVIVTH
jgi:DHA1 family bicyclomycin/chloramphenicol resistance-like MFS transporter